MVLASNRPDCEDIKRSTAGVLFLGTPHEGTDVAGYGSFIAKLKRNDPSLIQSLKPTDEDLYAFKYLVFLREAGQCIRRWTCENQSKYVT